MITITTEETISRINSEIFERQLSNLVENDDEIVIDMKDTLYISSIALRIFLRAAKKRNNNHLSPLKIINVTPTVKNIFELTGFVGFLDIE